MDYLVKKDRDGAIGIDSGLLSLHLENLADQHYMAANEAVQVSRRNAGVDDLLTHGAIGARRIVKSQFSLMATAMLFSYAGIATCLPM